MSSLPWLHYSQLQHPAVDADDSNPRISWGKYITVNGRITLPVSLFVNHALADGLHISRFFQIWRMNWLFWPSAGTKVDFRGICRKKERIAAPVC